MPRKILAFVLMAFALANAARCALAVQQAIHLPELPQPMSAWANAATGAVWAVGFGAAGLGALAGMRIMRAGSVALMAVYHAHLWLNRAAFARAENAPLTAGFNLGLAALAVGVVAVLAFAWRAPRPQKT